MKKNMKKILLILIVMALILILGFFVYTGFNGNGNSNNNSNNGQNSGGNSGSVSYDITKVYQVDLDAGERAHLVGDKEVRIKVLEGVLYVNDNKIPDVKAENAYITDQIVIFTYKGKCHNIMSYVVDKNGKEVSFTKNNYQLYDFRTLDGQCVAAGSEVCPCDMSDNCYENYAITFTYDGSKLIIE